MIIRDATNADGNEVITMIFAVLAEYGLKGESGETDKCLTDIEGNYLNRGGCFEVVLNDAGQIVGSWGLYPHGSDVCELRKMYLKPEARGHGLGLNLMDRALAKARELGFRRIELDTASCLKEALNLYKKFGFRVIDKVGIPARCDTAMALDL